MSKSWVSKANVSDKWIPTRMGRHNTQRRRGHSK